MALPARRSPAFFVREQFLPAMMLQKQSLFPHTGAPPVGWGGGDMDPHLAQAAAPRAALVPAGRCACGAARASAEALASAARRGKHAFRTHARATPLSCCAHPEKALWVETSRAGV